MSEIKKVDHQASFILPNADPLGIRKVSLPGSPPSLQIEAEIAVRQWASQNGTKSKGHIDVRSETKKG